MTVPPVRFPIAISRPAATPSGSMYEMAVSACFLSSSFGRGRAVDDVMASLRQLRLDRGQQLGGRGDDGAGAHLRHPLALEALAPADLDVDREQHDVGGGDVLGDSGVSVPMVP